MANESLLHDKRILIADDEPDVLDALEELLKMCKTARAESFEEAKRSLETEPFDLAIIDIMGIDGYKLLEIANRKGVHAVMLTAHALSPDGVVRSFAQGAASYIPKDKMKNIVTYLNDIFEAQEKGKNVRWRWLDRFASFFAERFGPDWQEKDKEFWEQFKYRI